MAQLSQYEIKRIFTELRLKEPDEQYLRAALQSPLDVGGGFLAGKGITDNEYATLYQKLQENSKDSIDSAELGRFHAAMTKALGNKGTYLQQAA